MAISRAIPVKWAPSPFPDAGPADKGWRRAGNRGGSGNAEPVAGTVCVFSVVVRMGFLLGMGQL